MSVAYIIANKEGTGVSILSNAKQFVFDENTNEELIRFREKLHKKETNYNQLYANIQQAVEEHNLKQKS